MSRTIVVLGGGGVKGMAHVGAWKALQESGIEAAEVIGTSIGGLVAAAIGAGGSWETLAPRALTLQKPDIVTLNRWALLFNGIRQPSVFHEETLRAFIASVLGSTTFEELTLPVSMNAVHLDTGREEWFGEGGRTDVPLVDAVYASCALPLFYPPAQIGGRYYVDGGVADPLPVRRAAERGADRIVAIDVGAGPVRDAKDTVAAGLVAIHHRVFDIMAWERKRALLDAWTGPELVYVRPDMDNYSTFDFTRTQYFLEEGYRATRRALGGRPRAAPPIEVPPDDPAEATG
jgi:NTE family protein